MAENGILKVGRKTDFQAHQIEHQLGAYTDCNHGQGLAVIQPAYYRYIVNSADNKFARIATEVFSVTETLDTNAAIEKLEDFIKECGLPASLSELDSEVEINKDLLREVADSCNLIQTNPQPLTHDDIYKILISVI